MSVSGRSAPPEHDERGWTKYVWLIFLPGFLVEPALRRTSTWAWVVYVAAAALFVVVYFRAQRAAGQQLTVVVLVTTVLGLALSPFNPAAYIFFTYAASFAATFDRSSEAAGWIVVVTTIGLVIGFPIHAPLYYWLGHGVFTPLIGAVNLHFAQVERANAKVRAANAQAQLAALRAQLHPHMMFNSLNTAVSLVRTGDNELAVSVLTDLSEILRHVLRGAAIQEVPLSEEIGFVERCIALERARFPDRVDAVFDIDWSVRDALVPNLILQPIVENALRHGITQREAGGLLEIAAHAQNEVLVLSVRDNGPGFGDLNARGGLGLGITSERLHHFYGGRASLLLANRPGGGAEVFLRLPLHARPAAQSISGMARSTGAAHLAVGD